MDMEKLPAWDDMASLAVMIPVYEEDVIYTLNDPDYIQNLNKIENTNWTRLTYLKSKYPDEWTNFVNRMAD